MDEIIAHIYDYFLLYFINYIEYEKNALLDILYKCCVFDKTNNTNN